jgi:hypothetical protein
MNKSDEEDIYYISDQDSTDDKPQIESIIKEKTKIFENEKYFIKILLSEHHHDLRSKFFTNIRRVHNSIYQAIKREIRNSLNPYRIFVDKENEAPKDLQELYELLKLYYKEKNFNNTFFTNYFKDLKAANDNKHKSKFLNMIPKDEIETLNDIQRKVTIIKSLRHYLNTSIRDRFQINFEQKKAMFNEDEFNIMYKYMVIKKDIFSKMKENEIDEYISNKKNSFKLRRPLNDYNIYNYLPILCKGYCHKEAKLFMEIFERAFNNHGDKCKKCTELFKNIDKIKSQIKSLYTKTCIFSHNINEIMFHPLFFNSFSNNQFYLNQFKNKDNLNLEEIVNIVETNQPPKKYKTFKNIFTRIIYNPSDNGMKDIFNKLNNYASKVGLFGNNCFLPKYKTNQCPIDLFKPNVKDFETHMIKCPFYHNNLEKRRKLKIKENEICKEVIKNGKWKIDKNSIKCKNSDLCTKFHTRNEVFYDERNFRKLYPCDKNKYCQKGDLCPNKHPTDMKIDEMYLPSDSKRDLERQLKKLIEKSKKIRNKEKKLSKIQCISCLEYISGEKGINLYKFRTCNHSICSKCYDFYKLCPLCCRINNYINEEEDKDDIIYIDLNCNNDKILLFNDDDINIGDDINENNEKDEKANDDIINEEKEEEGEKDQYIFNECNDINYSDSDDSNNDSKNSNINEEEIDTNNNKENENSFIDSSKSTNYNHNSGNIRGRGTKGRGRGDYTGYPGRGNKSRGYNNNDSCNNYNSYNNSYFRGKSGYNRGKNNSYYNYNNKNNDYEQNSDNYSNNNLEIDNDIKSEEKKEKNSDNDSVDKNVESRGKGRVRGKNQGRGRGRGRGRARGRGKGRYNGRDINEDNNNSNGE